MKFIFRWAFRLFIVLVILAIAGILFLDPLAREFAEYQFKNRTGLEASIGRLHVGLLNPVLRIENLVVYNSAAFGGGPFIEMPELQVEYDRNALRAGKLHCQLVRFNLAQMNLVEDAKGRHNFELLQKQLNQTLASTNPVVKKTASPKSPSKIDFVGIDTLNLTLGKLTYLRMKQPAKVDELKLNVNHQVFTNLKSGDDLTGTLMVALLRSGVNLVQTSSAQNWLQLLVLPKK